MNIEEFQKRVSAVDWGKYSSPKYHDSDNMDYDPGKVPAILIQLSKNDETNVPFGLGCSIRFALGNDHRGTYYPAALEAVDFTIEIEKHSDDSAVRRLAYSILNTWYYFNLEMSKDDKDLHEALDRVMREKLEPYEDKTTM